MWSEAGECVHSSTGALQSDLPMRWEGEGRHQGASVSGLGNGTEGVHDQRWEQKQETSAAWGGGGGGRGWGEAAGLSRFAGLEGPRSS